MTKRQLTKIASVSVVVLLILGLMVLWFPNVPAKADANQIKEGPRVPSPPNPPPKINGHGTGFIPLRVDLSHLTGQALPAKLKANVGTPPASFDWRTTGKVTPIKDQGACGSCWSFASIGNIESKLLIDKGLTYDFSENSVKECNYTEVNNIGGGNSCSGGNYFIAANYLSQKGTVLETCDPYVAGDVSCTSGCAYQKTLLDWRIICGDVVPNTAVLKTSIQTYGPVYTTIFAGNESTPAWQNEFGTYNGSYTLYYTGTQTPNHAVVIVGWDDSLTHAGGTGGWIVKNSWGTSWGGTCGYGTEKGYFTIAYGSASIGKNSSYIYSWQDYDNASQLLYYDEAGFTSAWGTGSTTAWGLAKYVPASNGYVTRVEFWTADVTTDVDIYIYDSFDGSTLSTLLASKENNSFTEAGYHSVQLDTPLAVTAGNDVIAVVKFTDSSYGYPVVADTLGPYASGRTYFSLTGANGTWIDMGGLYAAEVGIRLRTGSPAPTFSSAATNAAGTAITITFNKSMANPAGKQGEFSFKIGATPRSFSAAALNADNTKIDLTVQGAAIAHGDVVTVSYTKGTVQAADGGVLESFVDQAVTNNVPAAAPTVTSVTPNSGCQGQTLNVTIIGTNFTGATAVSFGAGITVNSFTVDSNTQITAGITIAGGAALGTRNVSVTTAAGTGTMTAGFTVTLPLVKNFVTGGGNIKDGKKITWNMSGNVGFLPNGTIVGNFQIKDFVSGKQYKCHNAFTSLVFSGSPTSSPPAGYNIATFSGNFTDKSGVVVPLTVIITDNAESGRGADTITITGLTGFPSGAISNGNYQVHDGYK